MAVSGYYNIGLQELLNGTIDYLNDDLHVMLVNDTYVFNPDHDFVSEVASAEISTTGYVPGFNQSGRHLLTGKAINKRDETDIVFYDATDPLWPLLGAGQIVQALVLIKQITSDALSRLIFYISTGGRVTDGQDFPVIFDVDGLARLRKPII